MVCTKTFGAPKSNFKLVLFLVVLASVGLIYSHCVKHSLGNVVSQCADSGKIISTFKVSSDKFIQVCDISQDTIYKFGFRILERINGKLEEITAYPKEYFKTYTDVIKYMDKMGFSKVNQIK